MRNSFDAPPLHADFTLAQNISPLLDAQQGLPLLLRHRLQRIANDPALDADALLTKLLHLLPNTGFDCENELNVALADERDARAWAAGTCGTAHAVDVVVRVARDVVVDDKGDGGDVEAAGGDVGCDEDPGGLSTEAGEVGDAVCLLEARV